MELRIASDPALTASPGDFGVRVDAAGETLFVSAAVVRTLQDLGVSTPRDWLASLRAFPESYASVLAWTTADVQQAAENLRRELAAVIELPSPRTAPPRVYGAMPPNRRARGR